jgi:hypothetical protein
MISIGDLPSRDLNGRAFVASADGKVVAGTGSSATTTEAFIWNETSGIRSLRETLVAGGVDLTGWTLSSAIGISADGRSSTGIGTNPADLER